MHSQNSPKPISNSTANVGSPRSAFNSPRLATHRQVIKAGDTARKNHVKLEEEQQHLIYVSKRNITTDLSDWKTKIEYHTSSGSDAETTIPSLFELNKSYLSIQQTRASKFLNLYRNPLTGEYYVESFMLSGSTDAVKSSPELINNVPGKVRGFMYVVVMRKNDTNFNSSTPQVEIRLAPFIQEGTTLTNHGGAVNTQTEAVLISGEIYFEKHKPRVANTQSNTFKVKGNNPFGLPDNETQRRIFAELFEDQHTTIDDTHFFCCNGLDEYLWTHYLKIGFYDQLVGPVLERLTRRILTDNTLMPALKDMGISSVDEIQTKVKNPKQFIDSILEPRKHLIDTNKTNAEVDAYWQAQKNEVNEFETIKIKLKEKKFEDLSIKNIKELLLRITSIDAIEFRQAFKIMQIDDMEHLELAPLIQLLQVLSIRAFYNLQDFYSDPIMDKPTFYLNHYHKASRMDVDDGAIAEIQATKQGNQLVLQVDAKTAAKKVASVVVKNTPQGFEFKCIPITVIPTQTLQLSASRLPMLFNSSSSSVTSFFMSKSSSSNSVSNNGFIANSNDSRPTSPIQAVSLVYASSKILNTDLSVWKEQFQYHKRIGKDAEVASSEYQRAVSGSLTLYKNPETSEYYVESSSKSAPELINNEPGKVRGFMYVVVMCMNDTNFDSSTPQVEIRLAPFIQAGTSWADRGCAVNPQTEAILISGEIYFRENKLFVANTKMNENTEHLFELPGEWLQRRIFTELFQDKNTKIDHTKFFCCTALDEALWKHYLEIGFYDQFTAPLLEQLTRRILFDDTLIPALHKEQIHDFKDIRTKPIQYESFINTILLPRINYIDTEKTQEEINEYWHARIRAVQEFKMIKEKLESKEFKSLTINNIKELLVRAQSETALQTMKKRMIMQIEDVDNISLKNLYEMLAEFPTGDEDFYPDVLINTNSLYANHYQTQAAAMNVDDGALPEIQATLQGDKLILEVDAKTAAEVSSVIVQNAAQGFKSKYMAALTVPTQTLHLSGSRSALLLKNSSSSVMGSSFFMGKSSSCNSIPNNGTITNSDSRPTSPIQLGGSSSEEDTLFRESTVSLRKANS